MAPPGLRDQAKAFPTQPGVYLWRNATREVLYVGKAQNLRARILQYFGPQEDERKAEMVEAARHVEFIAVESPKEALVLEQTLIKLHTPPYNVRLVDDKGYPYLAVTQEEWPRVVYTRDLQLKGTFFGPFPDAYKAKRVGRMLNQTFQLRQCRQLPKRECLYYHLKQCSAPCIGAVTPAAYREQVRAARQFLQGRGGDLRDRLRGEMLSAAEALRFERAAELRDLATAVESVLERQRMAAIGGDDYDALGVASRDQRWCVVVLAVRGGAVVGRESYFLNGPKGTPTPQVLSAFLDQFYLQAPQVPGEILLPAPIDEPEAAEKLLGELQAHAVRLRVPERGTRRQHVELAEKNALLLLDQEFLVRERRGDEGVEGLRTALGLADPPAHVECFDISHHAGQHTVASLVVFRDGQPAKSHYRRLKIRTTSGGDDPGALREAVQRRYSRVLAEEGADALPDLLVVDGGRAQVQAAWEALRTLGLEGLPLIGLAKQHEEIHRPHQLHPLRLDARSPALHLLQRARDEAHRFAIRYQAVLKRRAFITSELDDIPGVGPERRRRLLATFGSVEAIRAATQDELARVPGVPRVIAQRILEALKESKTATVAEHGAGLPP